MARWRINVEQETCVGSGTCTALAPLRFQLNDEDRSFSVDVECDPDDSVLEAANMCPTGSITVRDVETGRQVL